MSEGSAQPAAAKGVKAVAIEMAVVVLIGAALGVTCAAMSGGAASSDDKTAAAAAPVQPSTVYDLPPIVTNLGAPQDTWIRLEGSIVFDPATLPHPEAVGGKIGDDLLGYLRTVSLKQLEGPIGLENIRQDLNERVATRTGGKVREFVIRTLVVQ
jgi:flagellar protein FliL